MNKFNFDINGTALFITVMSEKAVRVTYGKNSPSGEHDSEGKGCGKYRC